MKSGATILRNTWKNSKFFQAIPFTREGACDRLLLIIAISLAAFGLVMVYSASYIFSQEKFGNGLFFFTKHLVFLGIGLSGMALLRFLDHRVWQKLALPLFLFTLFLMALVLVPGVGTNAKGASRWLNLGPFSLQPVEFAKVALILYMASRFAKQQSKESMNDIKSGFLFHLWPPIALIALCMLQPDFGSSALIIAASGIMLYLAGVKMRYLLGTVLAILPFITAALLLAPYRRARLLAFLDPWADPQGKGFQIIQSFIAFYRGGLFGVGLGNSKAKVFYLPEAHNDFILSVVGEELGFIGIGLLSLAFLLLIFRGIRIAAKANATFPALAAAGLTVLLGLEVFWNAAIVLGLFPTKGMNLPFISSGGSSIICATAIVGILLSISAQSRTTDR